jgi:hypothetical protein
LLTRLSVSTAAANGHHAVLLDGVEQLLTTLLLQHFANELAQGVHVLAQRLMLGWEMNLTAVHGE